VGIARFVAKRVALGALTLLAVSLLVFLLTNALGDPAEAVLGRDARQPAVLEAKRVELGLDRPLPAQYGDWLWNAVHGDFGESYSTGQPIRSELTERLVNSLVLVLCGAALGIPAALWLGCYSALRRDRAFDTVTNHTALVLAAIPEFVIATVLTAVFSVGVFEILPAVSSVRGGTRPWNDLDGMVLPAVTLALITIPYVLRSMRASMIEVLDSDFITSARLNGLPARTVLWRQALPNAVGSTLQVIALSLAYLSGGIVVVEKVFNYPGIGTALVDAIAIHNVPVVQFIAIVIAAIYVICNTLADIGTVLVTPRLRTSLT
jgi:peptide/nickel transport system permease protein